ncbi:MAG: HAMP domain-containing sensor histidine kinase [Clostridium sp.]
MFSSTKTKKLFSYFALSLVSLSLVISLVFLFSFRNYAIEFHKEDMLKRASPISSALSSFMTSKSPSHGFGAYLRFLDDIAGSDVWIVDNNLNILSSSCSDIGSSNASSLPEGSNDIVSQVLKNETAYKEYSSSVLSDTSITLGVPIKGDNSRIIGALILHSPTNYSKSLMSSSVVMLIGSLIIGLVLSFLLSLWLSKRFTDPIILKEAEDAIKLDKIRSSFVANVSHELRTPITVIRGFSELLESGIVKDENKVRDYTSQIVEESKYLQNMVNDLLDLSKLQNIDFPMEMDRVNISEVLLDACRSQSKACLDKHITLNTNIESSNISINGDYFRLRQLILILIDNAIKFSYEGSSIDIILTNDSLVIQDYGTGIMEDEIPYIFDRFHKSRDEKNKSGSGLGLAIAKQISDRHGFKIQAMSHSNGTMFIIKFDQNLIK